jgi:hypothetical protein
MNVALACPPRMSVLTAPTDGSSRARPCGGFSRPRERVFWSSRWPCRWSFVLQGLSVNGFTQDEVAKLHAIEAYRQGDFSANAETPDADEAGDVGQPCRR